MSNPMIEIIEPAWVMSLQDQGRYGNQRYGVPVSGPMDWIAQYSANQLTGNDADAACIELGLSTAQISVLADCLLATAGQGYRLHVNGRVTPMFMALWCHRGDQVVLEKISGGNWAYISIAGGWDVPVILGSRSTFLPAGLGLPIQTGMRIGSKAYQPESRSLSGKSLPQQSRPAYAQALTVRITSGIHEDRFTADSLETFWQSTYQLSEKYDRMGYRLQGEALKHINGADIISQGMLLGTLQVAGDGQPMVMMADHPTTGGYTQLAVVIRADLPLVSQCEPSTGRLCFKKVTLAQAHMAYTQQKKLIQEGIHSTTEEWTYL